MTHPGADRVLIRAKDIGLLIGILTLGSMVWTMYKKPAEWDAAAEDVRTLKPRVESIEKTMIANTERFSYIIKQLDAIDRKVGR